MIFHEIQLRNPLIYNGQKISFYTDFEIGEGIARGAIKSEGDFKKVTQQLHPSIYPNRHLLSLLVALTSVRY